MEFQKVPYMTAYTSLGEHEPKLGVAFRILSIFLHSGMEPCMLGIRTRQIPFPS